MIDEFMLSQKNLAEKICNFVQTNPRFISIIYFIFSSLLNEAAAQQNSFSSASSLPTKFSGMWTCASSVFC